MYANGPCSIGNVARRVVAFSFRGAFLFPFSVFPYRCSILVNSACFLFAIPELAFPSILDRSIRSANVFIRFPKASDDSRATVAVHLRTHSRFQFLFLRKFLSSHRDVIGGNFPTVDAADNADCAGVAKSVGGRANRQRGFVDSPPVEMWENAGKTPSSNSDVIELPNSGFHEICNRPE